ncbi:MAG: Low-affinity inorganic phosphate transporter 1 [Candidatus Anoxychlamydiales bacterium]|nr:Low-affinity inorganic phosphate transporter 1 [Candidatus Anoxychlamydiales bacterium]
MELKILEFLTLIVGIYMAWNIGANDVANAISTSVGSKALTLKKAVIIAALLEFFGAYFLGGNVSQTIQSGIVNPDVFKNDYLIFILGMMSALLATGLWLNFASYLRMPVSTTHAIIGAVVGFGSVIGGVHAVNWTLVLQIALSWIITPAISGVISYYIFIFLQRKILYSLSPLKATKKIVPILVFFTIFVFLQSLIFSKITNLKLPFSTSFAFIIVLILALAIAVISYFLINKIKIDSCHVVLHHPNQVLSLEKAHKHLLRLKLSSKGDTKEKVSKITNEVNEMLSDIKEKTKFSEMSKEYLKVEKVFGFLQIISLSLIAFAHGSNDVANAIGPVSAIIQTINLKNVNISGLVPPWILLIGASGIVLGLATWGYRVVETIGHKITTLTPTRGFSAEFGAATTILIASKLALPISTTHALVGSVLGVGLAKGLTSLNLKMLKDIVLSWIITLPICAILSILVFYLLKFFFY